MELVGVLAEVKALAESSIVFLSENTRTSIVGNFLAEGCENFAKVKNANSGESEKKEN